MTTDKDKWIRWTLYAGVLPAVKRPQLKQKLSDIVIIFTAMFKNNIILFVDVHQRWEMIWRWQFMNVLLDSVEAAC